MFFERFMSCLVTGMQINNLLLLDASGILMHSGRFLPAKAGIVHHRWASNDCCGGSFSVRAICVLPQWPGSPPPSSSCSSGARLLRRSCDPGSIVHGRKQRRIRRKPIDRSVRTSGKGTTKVIGAEIDPSHPPLSHPVLDRNNWPLHPSSFCCSTADENKWKNR